VDLENFHAIHRHHLNKRATTTELMRRSIKLGEDL